jgi:hypothetical protein
MKAQHQLQAQMRDAYERFQRSDLSQNAFCQVEGISKGKFNYWCRKFKQMPSVPLISTEKTKVGNKVNQLNEPSGFTPLSLPITQTPTPLMVLDIVGKGRLEFYAPVEASFLRALIS